MGRYAKLLEQIAKVNILLLDDWGFADFDNATRRDLLEIFDDRHNKQSTIVTSHLPIEKWHKALGDATMAGAILDRLVHNAHRINLMGESMKQKMSTIHKTTKNLEISSQKKRKFNQNSKTKRCALTVQVRWTSVQVLAFYCTSVSGLAVQVLSNMQVAQCHR